MTMKKNGGRGRSKRQRTPTTLYSDENPSTFTTKKKKGGKSDVSQPLERIPQQQNKFDELEEDRSPRRPSRKKKEYNRHSLQSTTFSTKEDSQQDENDHFNEGTSKQSQKTTGAGRKRRRPSGSFLPQDQMNPTKNSNLRHICPVASPLPKSSPSPSRRKATTRRLVNEGTFLSHSVQVIPILPSVIPENERSRMQQQYPSIFGNGLDKDFTVEKADWTPLYSPDVFFEDDYNSDDSRELDLSILPVTRSITCVTIAKPNQEYMAVADDAGFCIIYSLGTHIRPVARLETVACQQRSRDQQERIREQISKSKGKRRSLMMDTSETTIHAIGMVGPRVVIATSCELECMDIPSQSSLWVCPLNADRIVTYLDVHVETFNILVSCDVAKSKIRGPYFGQAPTSPLMLLQHSQNNIEICDANSPLLVKSPCCTAIWDVSETDEQRLLFVAVSNTDQELELVLVQGGSIDNWKVACKTRIPVKAANHQTSLCQSDKGTYTVVAGSRGIRLYQTETLQLINTYGDQLALHGKSVVWQDCLLVNASQLNKRMQPSTREGELLCDDWLSEADGNKLSSELGVYVVGIPSVKGPKELCEAIHIWKTDQPRTVPSLSLPLPAKAEGVHGLLNAPVMGYDRFVLATSDGTGHTLLPKFRSNFAGIMYPPGYNIITDNLEYVENEDELDISDSSPPAADRREEVNILSESEEIDNDSGEAIRRSLLHQGDESELEVNILDDSSSDTKDQIIVPCRPEPYLRQRINKSNSEDGSGDSENAHADAVGTPVDNSAPLFIDKILSKMPNMYKKKELSEDGITVSVTKIIAATPNPISNRSGRGKRSRPTNLEAMRKSSINSRLQKYMLSRENIWTDGSRSMCIPVKEEKVPEGAIVTPPSATDEVDDPKSVVINGEASGADAKFASGLVEVVSRTTTNGEEPVPTVKTDSEGGKKRALETAVAFGLLDLSPPTLGGISPNCTSDPASCGSPANTASGVTSETASDVGTSNLNLTLSTRKQDNDCFACKGRHVLHTCGRRALPIDYDEVAKAERQKKEKEEDAKKKARAEKRRQADARRREARKLKQRELEEQREREEEVERLIPSEPAFAKPQRSNFLSYQEQLQAPVATEAAVAPIYSQPTTIAATLGSNAQNETSLIQTIIRNAAAHKGSMFLQALQEQLGLTQAAMASTYSQPSALATAAAQQITQGGLRGQLSLLQSLQEQQRHALASPLGQAPAVSAFVQPVVHTLETTSSQPRTQNDSSNRGATESASGPSYSEPATLAASAASSNLSTETKPGPSCTQSFVQTQAPTTPPSASKLSAAPITRHASVGTMVSADGLIALANFADAQTSSNSGGQASTQTNEEVKKPQAESAEHAFSAGVLSVPAQPRNTIPTFASLRSGDVLNSAIHPRTEVQIGQNPTPGTALLSGNVQTTGGFVWPPVQTERYTGSYFNSTVSEAYRGDGGTS